MTEGKAYIAFIASIGAAISGFLGGWDVPLQTLLVFVIVDLTTGMAVAAAFHNSRKTENGSADGRVFLKGVMKKLVMFGAVGISAFLDKLMNTPMVCRTAMILFFIGNEGLSICENIGLMGVPIPKFLRKALEMLKDKNDDIYKGDDDDE